MILVVNSTVYGGSGGSVGTYSLASGATEIAIHEMGHTAFGFADEYAYYAGSATPQASLTDALSTSDLVLKGVKRVPSWARVRAAVGPPETVYRLSGEMDRIIQLMMLGPEEWALLSMLSEPRADVAFTV